MYCSQCGKQIQEHSRFCRFCGAYVACSGTGDVSAAAGGYSVDQSKRTRDVREGLLVYLHDVLTMEYSVDKLRRQRQLAEDTIATHDEWFYWECYDLSPPILWYDSAPLTKLYLCYAYKRNQYLFSITGKKATTFYDHDGNEVHDARGKPGYNLRVMDKRTRDRLCTLPVFRKRMFGDRELINGSAVYWGERPEILYQNQKVYEGLQWFAQLRSRIEQFEEKVRRREEDYQKNLPALRRKIQDIGKELEQAESMRDALYGLNLIPFVFRNLGCAYFIYTYFSTSYTTLEDVFLHLDLDAIRSQLRTVIQNQQESMLRQAIMIAQNREMLSQNQRLFEELSNMRHTVNHAQGNMETVLDGIRQSSAEAAQWAQMAALNAEICAWVNISEYIRE